MKLHWKPYMSIERKPAHAHIKKNATVAAASLPGNVTCFLLHRVRHLKRVVGLLQHTHRSKSETFCTLLYTLISTYRNHASPRWRRGACRNRGSGGTPRWSVRRKRCSSSQALVSCEWVHFNRAQQQQQQQQQPCLRLRAVSRGPLTAPLAGRGVTGGGGFLGRSVGRSDGRTDGRTDRQTDRQTDSMCISSVWLHRCPWRCWAYSQPQITQILLNK